MESPIMEDTKGELPKKRNGWITFQLEIGDKIVLFLVICQGLYAMYYFIKLLPNDQFRIELAIYSVLSYVLFFMCFCLFFYARNIWYILFLASIFFNLTFINNVIKNDFNKLKLLFTEISQSKNDFPKFLKMEQSGRGPEYFKWAYRNIDTTTFVIYYLAGSNLKSRKYPADLDWVDSDDKQFFYIILHNKSELEKEQEIANFKATPAEPK
jgi:hypothetical protein